MSELLLIDTREQDPWKFGPGVRTLRRKLPVGDYSFMGLTRKVAVERKSPEDLLGTMRLAGRDRFARELARAASMGTDLWVVCDGLPEDVINGTPYSAMSGSRALASLCGLCHVYGARLSFAGSRYGAADLTLAILRGVARASKGGKDG